VREIKNLRHNLSDLERTSVVISEVFRYHTVCLSVILQEMNGTREEVLQETLAFIDSSSSSFFVMFLPGEV